MDKWWIKSWTIATNVATAVVAGGAMLSGYPPVMAAIQAHPRMALSATLAVSVANIILRLKTSGPVVLANPDKAGG